MTLEAACSFALATLLFGLAPGPGVMAITATSLRADWRCGMVLSAGILTGDLIYLLLALQGLAALAQSLGTVFGWIRFLGAGYLIYLGSQLLFRPQSRSQTESPSQGRNTFLSGLLISLGNPKVILFYLGFLPMFWDLSRMTGLETAAVVGLTLGVLSLIFLGYALAAHYSGKRLRDRTVRRLQQGCGGLIILGGWRLAREP